MRQRSFGADIFNASRASSSVTVSVQVAKFSAEFVRCRSPPRHF